MVKQARMISKTSGKKEICVETIQLDEVANTICARIYSEDGAPCDKHIQEYSTGNHITEALDILTGLLLPIGTKFHVSIDFEIPEGKEQELRPIGV